MTSAAATAAADAAVAGSLLLSNPAKGDPMSLLVDGQDEGAQPLAMYETIYIPSSTQI